MYVTGYAKRAGAGGGLDDTKVLALRDLAEKLNRKRNTNKG